MWQVSGAHGRVDRERALRSMLAHFDAGFTTFDLADHYGPAEDFVAEHIAENARVFELTLEPEDHERIEAVRSGSRDLFRTIGDYGDEYRR